MSSPGGAGKLALACAFDINIVFARHLQDCIPDLLLYRNVICMTSFVY